MIFFFWWWRWWTRLPEIWTSLFLVDELVDGWLVFFLLLFWLCFCVNINMLSMPWQWWKTATINTYHHQIPLQYMYTKKNRHQQQRCYNPKMTSSSSGWKIYLNPMYIMALLLLLQHTSILLLYTFTKIHIEFRIATIWLWPYQHHYYYYYCYYPHT